MQSGWESGSASRGRGRRYKVGRKGNGEMSKSDIVYRVADDANMSRLAAETAVETVLSGIAEALERGDDVRIKGFDTFAVKNRPERTGRNPRTGESVVIPASTAVSFKAGNALKKAVNQADRAG